MQFEKGNKGRPLGSTNRDTNVKNAIKEGIDIDVLMEEIEQLPLKDRVNVKVKLLAFAYPKPAPQKLIEEKEINEWIVTIVEPNEPNRPPADETIDFRN